MNTHSEIFRELELRFDADNVYFQVISAILQAGEELKLPHRLELILAQPKNELMVHVPMRMGDGDYRLIKGYRVQHNNVLRPFKGGVRFHPEVGLDHVKALAALMTMKCALGGCPLAGPRAQSALIPAPSVATN